MHLYRQSIIVFGVVIPAVIAAIFIGAGYMAKSRMTASYNNKLSSVKGYEQSEKSVREIESKVAGQRTHLNRWSAQLSQETASAVATTLREIIDRLPSKEIQQTAFERPNATTGFGAVSAQNSSQIRIAFRGTFRTLQKALLELETRKPQLILQDIRIDPTSNNSSQVNLLVTYTAWEN